MHVESFSPWPTQNLHYAKDYLNCVSIERLPIVVN